MNRFHANTQTLRDNFKLLEFTSRLYLMESDIRLRWKADNAIAVYSCHNDEENRGSRWEVKHKHNKYIVSHSSELVHPFQCLLMIAQLHQAPIPSRSRSCASTIGLPTQHKPIRASIRNDCQFLERLLL